VPEPVAPRPDVLELALPVPEVVVSTMGATADESIGVVTVVESTVEGVVNTAESPLAEPSLPLLQATKEPATAKIRNAFFMLLLFCFASKVDITCF
jgi:hypothetical protein